VPFTPRSRIQAILQGEDADRVPFSIYRVLFPRGEAERHLRNQGLAVLERIPLCRVEMPNVDLFSREYYEGGVLTVRETARTPVGEVYRIIKLDPSLGTSWWDMHYFVKRPEDYKIVEFMVSDTIYYPSYDEFLLAQERWGEDGYVLGETSAGLWLGYSPMGLMMYKLLGVERFGIDLFDYPDEFFSLYETIREKQREMFQVCAQSPAEVVCYAGNIHQDTMGLQRFVEYYLPSINEFAAVMHEHGKLASCHYDAKMSSLVQAVAESSTDIVEAFTPFPDCDVSVGEARDAWPDKILWVNFPSSVHLESPERIRQTTLQVLSEAAPGDRFLMGVTEDIPESARQSSLNVILQTISEHGALPIEV